MTDTNTTKLARFTNNANRLGHNAETVAAALSFVGVDAQALCVWCAEHIEGQVTRPTKGGCCSKCSYSGLDCFVLVPE